MRAAAEEAELARPAEDGTSRCEAILRAALMLGVATAAFAAFAGRTSPSVTAEDPAEFQTLVPLVGVPHSGYPLYVALAHVLSWVLPGSPAGRVNLFSALTGACALATAVWFTGLLAAGRWPSRLFGGAVAATLLGYCHTFVLSATIAEMYALQVFLSLVAMGLLVAWAKAGPNARPWLLAGAFALLGALLGVHSTAVALYPGAAAFVALTSWRERRWPEGGAYALAAGLLGACFSWVGLFWVLWRHHVDLDHWALIRDCPEFFGVPREDSFWRSLFYELLNRQYQYEISSASPELVRLQLLALPHRFAAELFPAGAVAALLGWLEVGRRRWTCSLFAGLVVVVDAFLAVRLNLTFKTHFYFLVPNAIAACFAGAFAGRTHAWLSERLEALVLRARRKALVSRARHERTRALVGGIAFVLVSAGAGAAHALAVEPYRRWVDTLEPFVRDAAAPRVGERPTDRSNTGHADNVRALVRRMPPSSIVFVDWYEHFTFKYVGRVERLNEGLSVFESYPLGTGQREFPIDYVRLIEDPRRTRPVFFVFNARPPDLPGFELVSRGDALFELVRRDGTAVDGSSEQNATHE